MAATIFSFGFRILFGALAAAGLLALLLAGMIAWPLDPLPELKSISNARKSQDFSALPATARFQARDGTALAYRHYPAIAPTVNRIAVYVHGSSGSSRGAGHMLSMALAARGVETYAVDIRGHGESGSRGDIGYLGQLEDDLADLVAQIRKTSPAAPLTLMGHSSGGGFVLRMAGSKIQDLFARTVLLAPYLGYAAPSSRPNSGGWANADIPRFLALSLLRAAGISLGESLPAIVFAVPPNSSSVLTATYSYRLMRDFAASRDFRTDLAAARHPITVISGAADELIVSDKFGEIFGSRAVVRIIDGVDHMGIVGDPRAVSVIADDVAKFEVSSR
ncbi:alpha/beta fold hydrolase [Tardiphaga sp.]|uniref:alpha/beta hydrolase n=1 Tax=Tardiphaga sp. TaxID=1926292 RepID=UPI00261AE294|nr:alpha/beta fold hydrolase [Tardiphaga sp.]MDB5620987.1 alpha/beta hydrolase [Tardiphaga sp.]